MMLGEKGVLEEVKNSLTDVHKEIWTKNANAKPVEFSSPELIIGHDHSDQNVLYLLKVSNRANEESVPQIDQVRKSRSGQWKRVGTLDVKTGQVNDSKPTIDWDHESLTEVWWTSDHIHKEFGMPKSDMTNAW